MNKTKREGTNVIGTFIDALDFPAAIESITIWAKSHQSRTVCLCNVHSSVTARSDQKLADALSLSDMVLPDGAPVAWVMRRSGYPMQRRIAGPDLMIRLCEDLQKKDISIFLFGSSQNTLDKLEANLHSSFSGLQLAGSLTPKYGDWTEEEEQQYINKTTTRPAVVRLHKLHHRPSTAWAPRKTRTIHSIPCCNQIHPWFCVSAGYRVTPGVSPRNRGCHSIWHTAMLSGLRTCSPSNHTKQ